MHTFWESEVMPEEWEVGLLEILPKKGDKSAKSVEQALEDIQHVD